MVTTLKGPLTIGKGKVSPELEKKLRESYSLKPASKEDLTAKKEVEEVSKPKKAAKKKEVKK